MCGSGDPHDSRSGDRRYSCCFRRSRTWLCPLGLPVGFRGGEGFFGQEADFWVGMPIFWLGHRRKTFPRGLNRLRKKSGFESRFTKNIPRGLKPSVYFQPLVARLKSYPEEKQLHPVPTGRSQNGGLRTPGCTRGYCHVLPPGEADSAANGTFATLLVEWKLPHCVASRRRGVPQPDRPVWPEQKRKTPCDADDTQYRHHCPC